MYGDIQTLWNSKTCQVFPKFDKIMNILFQGKMVGHILSKEKIFNCYRFDKVKLGLQPFHFQHQ
jgi:hypothetical protein